MIKNELIKSLKSYNGHILLTIIPAATMKLSRFAFELEENEYCDAFYNTKGYLELYTLESVRKFLGANERHLNADLRQSILEDAENHFKNPEAANTENRRMSFFHQTKEKVPLSKLENLKDWLKKFHNLHEIPNMRDAFNEVFLVLFPHSKRQQKQGSPFFEVFEQGGRIEIESVSKVIGKAWADYYQFIDVANRAIAYPGNNLKKLAKEPEKLGSSWDILNKESFIKPLSDWLQTILTSKINPVDNQILCLEDLEKLQKHINFIQETFETLQSSNMHQCVM